MKNKLATIAVGASLIIGGGTVDLVPVTLPAQAWGQYRISDAPVDIPAWEEKTATGTIAHPAYIAPHFSDDNGDGIISYSIAVNKKGERVYTQISDDGYEKLGKKDGGMYNLEYPVIDKVTVAEAMLEGLAPKTAEASVAQDSANKYTACVSGTSCTYSFTNTAGNLVVNSSLSYTTNPGTVTMSYAGVSMTQVGSTQVVTDSGYSSYQYVFYTTSAAATGANNLVTNTTGSLTNGFYDHAVSFSGANASDPIEGITQTTTGVISNKSVTVTSTTDNTMAYWSLGSHYGRAYSAGSNTTLISGASDSQEWSFRSTNLISPAGSVTLNATISVGVEPSEITAFAIKPAGAQASSVQIQIIEPIIPWW